MHKHPKLHTKKLGNGHSFYKWVHHLVLLNRMLSSPQYLIQFAIIRLDNEEDIN